MLRIGVLVAALAAALLWGCTSNAPRRAAGTEGYCGQPNEGVKIIIADESCRTVQVEKMATAKQATEFSLVHVELNDEGSFQNRSQLNTLYRTLVREADPDGALIVVFVHGWFHSSDFADEDVGYFRNLLYRMQVIESRKAIIRARELGTEAHLGATWNKQVIPSHYKAADNAYQGQIRPRKVVGVYVGWRGTPITGAGLLEYATFWNWQNAAERVAEGSVRELFAGLKKIEQMLNQEHLKKHDPGSLSDDEARRQSKPADWIGAGPAPSWLDVSHATRLIIIGHSFGGLIVFEALAQYFIENATTVPGPAVTSGPASNASPSPVPGLPVASAAMPQDVLLSRPSSDACERGAEDIRGYGDMVILINPAFEGRRYEPIYDAMTARGDCYRRYQSPVLITISSQTDLATNYAFPLGQFVPSFDETFRDAEERKRAVNTPGHIDALTTHRLTAPAELAPHPIDGQVLFNECVNFRDFDAKERTDGLFAHQWKRTYDNGTELQMVGREIGPEQSVLGYFRQPQCYRWP